MQSFSLVMSECSLSGQFLHCGLRNFATASRRYAGDIHNSTVVGLFMTPTGHESDSNASRLSAHVYYTSAHLNPPTS